MNLTDIANYRLESQQIAATKFKKAKEIVQWMGAMQAQDFAMAKWAIGIRLPGSSHSAIEESLNKGEILRTHLLRPTWHFVSPKDIRWMLHLTAPQIKTSIRTRQKFLELTDGLLQKSNSVIEKAFAQKKQLLREDLVNALKNAGIPVDNNRASHILLSAELEGLICSGAQTDNKQYYTLLDHYSPKKTTFTRDEELAKLAKRYFSSHCPATLQDFSWWSGLSMRDSRTGLEAIKPGLISETIDSFTYWFPSSFSFSDINYRSVYMLPAYDEFIISYRNRDASIHAAHLKKSISINGIFRPFIVTGGKVTGIWKRTVSKDKLIIETTLFRSHTKGEISSIMKASEKLGQFLEKKIVLQNNE